MKSKALMRRTHFVRPFLASLPIVFLAGPCGAGISVKVMGNSFLKTYQIKEVLAPEPESYAKAGIEAWQDDAQFYTSDLYRKNGFFDAKVEVDVKPDSGGGTENWN